jgi:hypothetical protein
MEEWYVPVLGTISYNWDETNPGILKLTKTYNETRFHPVLLTKIHTKVNQQHNSKLLNHYSDLMRVKFIEEPGDPFPIPPRED